MDQNRSDLFYKAVLSRDARFDGKFFVAVKTTGIYCRPICPAKPKRQNVLFFTSALAAEKAGFRPCLRCRPESAPLSSAWIGKNALVQRALTLISTNTHLDKDEDTFALSLGVSARHLRRLFEEELGKTPKQISDQNRLNFARKLIVETNLAMTDIAFNSGFLSVRRFNDAIFKRFHRTPSELRRQNTNLPAEEGLNLTLAYRPPLDWKSLLGFYSNHHIQGVENTYDGKFERVFELGGALEGITGALRVEHDEARSQLKLKVVSENYRGLFEVAQRVRRMFDLDSDPLLVANAFADSRPLGLLCQKYRGVRIARGWDPFETSVCAILGQLVSTEQAGRLVAQLVTHYGKKTTNPFSGQSAYLFPSPKTLSKSTLAEIGTTQKRKESIRILSQLLVDNKISLMSAQDPKKFRELLLEIKGIGPWTTEYICMRALGDADAFPETDLILKRAVEKYPQMDLESLKPWRAYAAMYLWREYADTLSKKKRKTS